MGKRTGIRLVVMAVLLSLLGGLGMAAAQEGPTLPPALSPGARETEGGAPMLVSYQGQVLVSSTPYTGTGSFKFAVVNLAGDTSYWSNDGSSTGGGEPAASVPLTVDNGLFTVLLGDTSLSGMTHPLEAGDFAGTERALRVWFSSGSGFTLLSPDRRIAAAPYALQAQQAATAGDADTLDGLHASQVVADRAWVLAGNAGTDPAAEFLGTTDAQPLVLRTNNAERLRVDAAGRLGVGTASPTERLTVSGNARVLNDDNPLARDTAAVTGGGPKSVAVAGHRAYVVSMGSNLLSIYDVSDPDNVVAQGSTGTNLDLPASVAVAGRYAYVASQNNDRLAVFDVSDPNNIVAKGTTSSGLDGPGGVAVAGRYAYVASYNNSTLAVFDVSDPGSLVAKGTTGTNLSGPNSVTVAGRYAFVTSENNDSLSIFDVSDPNSIVAKGATSTNLNWPMSVAVAGRYAYVASFNNHTLAVFDVSNPSSIVFMGATSANIDTPRSVAVAGGPGTTYAYVASDFSRRLAVFDVTNPAAIVAKGYAATSGGPYSVALSGRYAYVVQWDPVLAVFELNHLDAPAASIGSLHAGRLDVGESGIVGHDLDVFGSLSVGQGALFGGPLSASALSVLGSPVWHAGNDGTGLGLDADLLDGSHASAFSLSGHNHDGAYVNEGQADSVTSSMILNGTLAFADIGPNGCTSGQVMQWNGSAWACAAAGTTDHGALTGLGDDDHTQYFALGQNETVTGIPAFNGGTSGSSAPFSVDSNTLVTNLNADLLDGQHSAYFSPTTHTHATLTAGSGLSGGTYNGGAAATFAVVYGAAANTAVQGNQAATITAGNGLTGGVSADALGDGFSATLNVGGGNGITAGADSLALGPFTADWSQTGAFDLVLANASSELRILESVGGAYYGALDVGDLAADQTYVFGTGGTVWTSGNDGTTSTLDADLLDGHDTSYFSISGHNHDAAYVNEGQASSVSSSMLQDGATLAEVLDDDGTGSTLDADLLDGHDTNYFSINGHNHDSVYVNEGQASSISSSMLQDGATLAEILDDDGTSSTLDADLLDGHDTNYFSINGHNHDTAYWMQNGNSFGAVGRLGTNDNNALELEVNAIRALRLEPNATSPNLVGGYSGNAVSSAYGATIGGGGASGAANSVTANYGTVPGGRAATVTHYGEMAYAGGAFATPGDAQTSTYVLRNTSNDATPVKLYLDGSAAKLTLAAGRSMTFDILITAMADNGEAASYQWVGGIKHTSDGWFGPVGGPPLQPWTREDDSNWSVSVGPDPVNSALDISCVGAAGLTIHWVAVVRTVETSEP